MSRKLQIAVSGLGRMGARHALHFFESTPRADLIAVCDPEPKSRAWAEDRLAPFGVRVYADFETMLDSEKLEAVVVATSTTVHAEQAIKAIERGLHVLCEKPLSTSVATSQAVVDAAAKRPELKVLCGFSRRFDASYRSAHAQLSAIGRPSIIRSQTCDRKMDTDYLIQYSQHSGGIFVDCNIHDLDLVHWFFGKDIKVKSVSAVGVRAIAPGLQKWQDADNAVGVIEFYGDQIAYVFGSRMMAAGQHDMTEIIGTTGKVVVNSNPMSDLVETHVSEGVKRTIPDSYYPRFYEAFVREAREFTDAW